MLKKEFDGSFPRWISLTLICEYSSLREGLHAGVLLTSDNRGRPSYDGGVAIVTLSEVYVKLTMMKAVSDVRQ